MNEKEILKHFDNLFSTSVIDHIKLNMTLIKGNVDRLCEIPTKPSPTYKVNMRKQIELSDKICEFLTDEQIEVFEEYKRVRNETNKLTDEQLFCFGYIFAKELEQEGNISKE